MFFDVIVRAQTWRNAGYLLLAFPLGIFYFVFLVTGLSLGFGLLITVVGIPILVGMLAAAYGLGEFERGLTNLMLDQNTPPAHRLGVTGGLREKVKALLRSSETWKGVAYLFAEFLFGIIGFTLVVTAAASFALIATPLFYVMEWWIPRDNWPSSFWVVDTLGESFLAAGGVLLAGFILLHLNNWVARAWRAFAGFMLAPTEPVVPVEHPHLEEKVSV